MFKFQDILKLFKRKQIDTKIPFDTISYLRSSIYPISNNQMCDEYYTNPITHRLMQFSNEEFLTEYNKVKTNIVYFAEFYCNVRLSDLQKQILEHMVNGDNPIFVKRQQGKTFCSKIFLLWSLVTAETKDSKLFYVSNNYNWSTIEDIMQTYHNIPPGMKPRIKWRNEKSTVVFENDIALRAISSNSNHVRGVTINACVLDEVEKKYQNDIDCFKASTHHHNGKFVYILTREP